MGWKMSDLKGDEVLARDGAVGTLDDVYFDDREWAVRYMVVDTGGWIAGRRMLVSPEAVEAAISDPGKLRIGATRAQLESAPGAEEAMPVKEQQRMAQARRLGPPYYWSNPMLWGATSTLPGVTPPGSGAVPATPAAEEVRDAAQRMTGDQDPHLRSSREVIGYDVQALDGALGKVEDFVIDEGTWKISEVVVDTTKWWPGGEVGVSPQQVERIDWAARKLHVRLSRDELKAAAEI
jgi:sporulation protein YlmC with PRC-barrel domain